MIAMLDNFRDISSLPSMLQHLLVTKFHALLLNLMTIYKKCCDSMNIVYVSCDDICIVSNSGYTQ